MNNNNNHVNIAIGRSRRNSCRSRSMADQFKDVFRGNRKGIQMGNCSPVSISSNELLTTMPQEAMINLKKSGFESVSYGSERYRNLVVSGNDHSISPETIGQQSNPAEHLPPAFYRKIVAPLLRHDSEAVIFKEPICSQKCTNLRALQSYPLSNHAVRVLNEGDSTRKIVEIIFKTSWLKSDIQCGKIERILKVNNLQNTVSRFEEYREIVKSKASGLPKKHPRCLADGNEVLRFHGSTIMCSLGANGLCSLCTFACCNVCQILRTGFPTKELEGRGIYTTATIGRAHDSINLHEDAGLMFPVKRAMLICRVIAGRVHRPLHSYESFCVPIGFDSVAGDVAGNNCKLEELFVSNPRAVLPCFVVIYS
eukprot:Gb_32332 [translate_table: standard]